MTDFAQLRAHMIDNQLRTSGVTDWRILAQMGAIARETFVPEARRATAYIDDVQWLNEARSGRFIAAPATFAKLLQLAEINPDETVLDIGAGTGYSTAVIAGLAASVVGYETDSNLLALARANIAALGLSNVTLTDDIAKYQYDVVFVEGSLATVPPAFFAALKEGGRLVASVLSGGVFVAHVHVKTGKSVAARSEFNAPMPPLITVRLPEEFVF